MLIMLIIAVILVKAGYDYYGSIDGIMIFISVLISIVPALLLSFIIVSGLEDHVPLVTERTEIQLHELPEDTRFIQVDTTISGRSVVIYCIEEEDGVKVISEVDASKSTFVEHDGKAKLVSNKSSYPWYLNIISYTKPVNSWEFYLPAR